MVSNSKKPTRVCVKCNRKILLSAKFCNNCGALQLVEPKTIAEIIEYVKHLEKTSVQKRQSKEKLLAEFLIHENALIGEIGKISSHNTERLSVNLEDYKIEMARKSSSRSIREFRAALHFAETGEHITDAEVVEMQILSGFWV